MKKTEKPAKKNTPASQKTPRAVHFANLYRYFFLPILVIVSLFLRGNTLLCMGIGFLAFALYSIIGYKCRWDHIYLAFQEMQKQRMTPNNIRWDTVRPFDALTFPVCFGILGLIMVIYQVFYM